MKLIRLLSGAALAAALATTALAQPAASPEKVALAKQMIDASGGAKQIDTLLDTMFKGADAMVNSSLPPEQKRLQTVLRDKMLARFKGMEPQMIDVMIKVYSDNLTEKELREALAYMQSETGQAMNRKLPQITAQTMQLLTPVMVTMMQGMKTDILETACQEAKCTPEDRAKVAEAMDKAFGKQPS